MKRTPPGRVVSIRVNPRDCMSVIDVTEAVKMRFPGISFSQVVSIALSSALESLRKAKAIPTREGFEFYDMMKSFPSKGGRARALDISETIALAGPDAQVPAVIHDSPERRRKQLRFEELQFKATQDLANMSEEEQNEYFALQAAGFE